MADPVVRWQLISSRPDDVTRFYGEVFGWTVSRANALGYRQFAADGGCPGGVWPAPPEAPTFVQLIVQVADVDAAIAAAIARGGQVVVPRSVLPDGEVMAILRDPFGTTVGVMTPPA